MTVYGVDVSHHQGGISWDRVYADGIRWAILKYTQGVSYGWTEEWLRPALAGAKAHGLLTGGYLFLMAGSPGDAQGVYYAQRAKAVGAAGGLHVIDCETGPDDGHPTAAQVDAAAKAVKREIPGAKVGLYTGRWYWGPIRRDDGTDASVLHGPPVPASVDYVWESRYVSGGDSWRRLAELIPSTWYGATRVGTRRTDIVQFSASGGVAGVAGAVDLDAFPGTLAELAAFSTTGGARDDMTPEEFAAAAVAGTLDPAFRRQAQVLAAYGIARSVDVRAAVAPLLDDQAEISAVVTDKASAVLGALAALPTDHLTDDERQALAADIAGRIPGLETSAVLDALAARLAS